MHFWLVTLPWRSLYARTFTGALSIALLFMTLCQSQAADTGPKRVCKGEAGDKPLHL